jgi:hypothetical protein
MNDIKQIIDLPEGGSFEIDEIKEDEDGYYDFILKGTRLTPKGQAKPSTIYVRSINTTERIFDPETWTDWCVVENDDLPVAIPQAIVNLEGVGTLRILEIYNRSGYYNFHIEGELFTQNKARRVDILVRSYANEIQDFFRYGWIDWKIIRRNNYAKRKSSN